MENIATLNNYIGTPLLYALYVPAFVYLVRREKTQWKRIALLYVPAAILVLFLLPPVRMVYTRLLNDTQTYYRVLWLVPFAATIVYAAVMLFDAHRRIGLIVCAAMIVLCGRLVYLSPYMSRAENNFHLPQIVLSVCDRVMPAEGEERVTCAFPPEMVHQVRQYTTRIRLPYGREMVDWSVYYNPVYEVMVKPETIDPVALAAALRDADCPYVVLAAGRRIQGTMEDVGFEEIAVVGNYRIYKDRYVD